MQSSQSQLVSNQSGAASWQSPWLPVAAVGFRLASFTIAWSAVASTDGELSLEGTDDPLKASPVPLTLAQTHGASLTVDANAGAALAIATNCPGYVRLVYTRTAGGGANQFQAHYTLTE